MNEMYNVSSNPHVRDKMSTNRLMQLVVIALLPATVFGIWNFGIHALLVVVVTVAASVFFEWLYDHFMHKSNTITDFSAVVTGILLAFNMPVTVPLWVLVAADIFSILIVKQMMYRLSRTENCARL